MQKQKTKDSKKKPEEIHCVRSSWKGNAREIKFRRVRDGIISIPAHEERKNVASWIVKISTTSVNPRKEVRSVHELPEYVRHKRMKLTQFHPLLTDG